MRIRTFALVVIAAALGTGAAFAQANQFPGAPGGGAFQPGVAGGAAFSLRPGGTVMLAAYCANLLADSPTSGVKLLADPVGAKVSVNGAVMPLLTAQKEGLVAIRGHGIMDPPQPADQGWLDLHVENLTATPMDIEVASGAVFTPIGQARPTLDPGVTRLLAAEKQTGNVGTAAACMAMWAATGSTFQDVSEQSFQFIPEASANLAQALLDTACIHHHFDTGGADYRSLYSSGIQSLGTGVHTARLPLKLADASQAIGELTWNGAGRGFMQVRLAGADTGRRLYYTAHLTEIPGGQLQVTLAQPKTGRALPDFKPFNFTPGA